MKKIWKKILGITAGLLVAFLVLPAQIEAAEQIDGRIVAPHTAAMMAPSYCNVRSGPSTSYARIGSMNAGDVVNVCGLTDNGWYQVVYGNGIAYISQGLLVEVPVDANMLNALAQQAVFVKQNLAQTASPMTVPAAASSVTVPPAASSAVPAVTAPAPVGGNLIFVGDSRTGYMSNAVGGSAAYPGTAFVACYGGGVDWLSSEAAKKEIDAFVGPGSVIIINYGVNDLSRHQDYITLINRYSQDWMSKGAAVFYASVGQVGENEYGKRNWAVEYFNNQLFSKLNANIGRIDLYAYLAMTGYNTLPDGIHYMPETSARMFAFLKGSVGR